MRREIYVAVVAALALLPACAGTQGIGGPVIALAEKSSPQGQPTGCDEMQGNTCIIKVAPSITGGNCTASMKQFVALGTMARVQHVQWELSNGFEFCTRGGDGVFFTDVNAPFDPDPSGPCKDRFKAKRNALSAANFSYSLRFRKGTAGCFIDPWIRNN